MLIYIRLQIQEAEAVSELATGNGSNDDAQ